MSTVKEMTEAIESMRSASFENKHGEKFTIHTDGVLVFMSGDEVNAMVSSEYKIADKYLQLFNDPFTVWSAEELNKLGKALQEVTGEFK